MPHDIHEVIERAPGSDDVRVIETDEDVRFTLVSRTLDTSAGTWELWAARSGAAGDLTVQALDRTLLVGAGLLVVVFGSSAWLLTTVALRPVARMRRTAQSLSDRPGGDQLPVGPARDELSDLAATLNDFIVRMRDTAQREREMVSAASHELRTPLAVAITQLELAHRHFGDAAALEREIRAAEGSMARLSALADNLLELSRLDAGASTPVSSTAAQLETEVMAAVDRMRLMAGPDGPDVELATGIEHPDARYPLSATAVGRILDNLGANALAATPPDGRIELGVRQEGRTAVVTVVDTGRGMPESFVPRAFERFSRPDEARAASDGGSGLGLALVQALISDASGSVTIANRPGGGVVVTATLPEQLNV
ncbi:HAMP domain-containing sensor histidine kinase [Rathayibacter oskolensis]|uniref:sensor histidine kinase n=1 Tax=Rathayibacter oskolensis TaxID=1891671 RepID=UPI00265E2548|nr:HAMP domain-containing sensor histidine kinase [Rathayibacter oskolensis]WKK70408.1 HAMP domain-containing sensor histidine kinase [Rathayibacter oskolensis]